MGFSFHKKVIKATGLNILFSFFKIFKMICFGFVVFKQIMPCAVYVCYRHMVVGCYFVI